MVTIFQPYFLTTLSTTPLSEVTRAYVTEESLTSESPTIIPTAAQIALLQRKTLDALISNRLAEAEILLQETEDLTNKALRHSPEDTTLLNLKGYHHKNVAMQFQRLSMDDQDINDHLTIAERTFKLILVLNEEDAGAWNGLGNVHLLRCELDEAEEAIQKALDINPEYPAAQHDLKLIPVYRNQCNL